MNLNGSSVSRRVDISDFGAAGEAVPPVVLVATALLVHYSETGEDLLKCNWTRWAAQTDRGLHVGLECSVGRLLVSDIWDTQRYSNFVVSSLRIS